MQSYKPLFNYLFIAKVECKKNHFQREAKDYNKKNKCPKIFIIFKNGKNLDRFQSVLKFRPFSKSIQKFRPFSKSVQKFRPLSKSGLNFWPIVSSDQNVRLF